MKIFSTAESSKPKKSMQIHAQAALNIPTID